MTTNLRMRATEMMLFLWDRGAVEDERIFQVINHVAPHPGSLTEIRESGKFNAMSQSALHSLLQRMVKDKWLFFDARSKIYTVNSLLHIESTEEWTTIWEFGLSQTLTDLEKLANTNAVTKEYVADVYSLSGMLSLFSRFMFRAYIGRFIRGQRVF